MSSFSNDLLNRIGFDYQSRGLAEATDGLIKTRDLINSVREAQSRGGPGNEGWLEMPATLGKVAVAGDLASLSVSKLTEMVKAGTITSEQYQAALNAQIKEDEALGQSLNLQTAVWAKNTDARIENIGVSSNSIRAYSQLTPAVQQQVQQLRQEGLALDQVMLQTKAWARMNGEAVPTLAQLKQHLIEEGVAIEQVNQAMARANTGVYEQIRGMRGMRYGGLEVIAMFSMMSMVLGESLPNSVRALEKSMMLISSGGMMTAMMGWGGGIGFVAGLLASLAIATFQVDQATQDLNKDLDRMAQQNELLNTLANLLNISKSDAQAMYDLAKSSSDAAVAVRDFVKAREEVPIGQKFADLIFDPEYARAAGEQTREYFIQGFTQGDFGAITKAILAVLSPGAVMGDLWVNARQQDVLQAGLNLQIAAQNDYTTKANTEAQKVADYNEKTQKSISDNNQRYLESMADAWISYNEGVARAGRSLTNQLNQLSFSRAQQIIQDNQRIAQIDQTYLDAQAKARQNYDNKVSDSARSLSDRLSDIERSKNEKLADSARSLSDRLSDIERSKNEKLADLNYDYQQKLRGLNDQRERSAYDLAYRLYQIERERTQRQDEISYNFQQRSEHAKTWNEYMSLVDDANHQTKVSNQNSNDQIEDANHSAARKEMDLESQKLQDFQDNYQHRQDIILRDAQDQIDTAKRTNQEQLDDAIRTNRDQLDDAKRTNQEQLDDAKRTLKEQFDAATDNYRKQTEAMKVELAAQEVAYNHNIENIKLRYREQTDDLKAQLWKQQAAVQQRWDAEIQNMQYAENKEAERHNLVMFNLQLELEKAQSVAGNQLGALGGLLAAGAMYGFGGYRAGGGNVSGGSTYVVGEKGPELLTLPSGTSGTVIPMGGGFQFVVQGNVYGVDDLNSWFEYAVQKWNKRSMGYVN